MVHGPCLLSLNYPRCERQTNERLSLLSALHPSLSYDLKFLCLWFAAHLLLLRRVPATVTDAHHTLT